LASKTAVFIGIAHRQWAGHLLISLAVFFLFTLVYLQARRSIIHEIRIHAMGVATATAAGLDTTLLDQIHNPDDAANPAYLSIQRVLNRVVMSTPDIRYVYTMRRSLKQNAPPTDYEYIVDTAAHDKNHNQVIDPDEISEPPGKPYDAKHLPEMVNAWNAPSADQTITADPPYPDLISGYAPIHNEQNQTVAIVGVDITADTVRAKLRALQSALLVVWLIITLLIIMLLQLYYRQRTALERIRHLSQELTDHNEKLTAANLDLAESNDRFKKEIRLARSMRNRLLPQSFPCQDKIRFEQFHKSGEMPGGDFYDVFALDDRRIALFMADVAGHGMSTALVAGLLKTVFSSAHEKASEAPFRFRADLGNPQAVLHALNEMLIKEIPEYEFITMIYAVLQLDNLKLSMALAGHPAPIRCSFKSGLAESWKAPVGPALGLISQGTYQVEERSVQSGDKLIFYTDGLLGMLNPNGESFGEERLLKVVQTHATKSTNELINSLRKAVEEHRGQSTVSDDYSLLIAEIR
jgi:serine phosphatase RsbU (regulator of sigma subunit)